MVQSPLSSVQQQEVSSLKRAVEQQRKSLEELRIKLEEKERVVKQVNSGAGIATVAAAAAAAASRTSPDEASAVNT